MKLIHQQTELLQYSAILDRNIKIKCLGSGGVICLMFPSFGNDSQTFIQKGLTQHMWRMIDQQYLSLYFVDDFDDFWTDRISSLSWKSLQYERWMIYMQFELVPYMNSLNESDQFVVCGIQTGAMYALNLYLRLPKQINQLFCMDGIYKPAYFLPNYQDAYLMKNTPSMVLYHMNEERCKLFQHHHMVFCGNQNVRCEADQLREIEEILKIKGMSYEIEYHQGDIEWSEWGRELDHYITRLCKL